MTTRLYRLLLLAYPAAFRRRFAPDMTAAFLALVNDRRHASGLAGVVLLWFRTLGDTLSNGLAERAAMRRGRRHSSSRHPSSNGRFRMWASFKHDVRDALRTMRRSPVLKNTIFFAGPRSFSALSTSEPIKAPLSNFTTHPRPAEIGLMFSVISWP